MLRRVFALALALAALALPAFALAQDAPPLDDEVKAEVQSRPAPVQSRPAPAPAPPARPQAVSLPRSQPARLPLGAPDAASPGRPLQLKPSGVSRPVTAQAPAVKAQGAPRGPAVKNDGKRYLRSLDENHDARVSREEYLAGTKKRFAKIDANNDGTISVSEARAAKAKLAERKAKNDARRRTKGLPPVGSPARAEAKPKADRPPRPYLAAVDANHDGRVTRKEYLARREKQFAEIDVNRDGVIGKEEARAAKARLLERRAQRKVEARERKARTAEKAAARADRARAGEDQAAAPVVSMPPRTPAEPAGQAAAQPTP